MSTTGSGSAQPLLDDQIEPFLQHLREAGYAERTLRKKRTIARAFARWAKRKGIATIDLNDGHADAFVLRLPRGGKSRLKFELAAVRLFLGHLRATADQQGPASQAPVSPTASLFNTTRITCARWQAKTLGRRTVKVGWRFRAASGK